MSFKSTQVKGKLGYHLSGVTQVGGGSPIIRTLMAHTHFGIQLPKPFQKFLYY